MDVHLLGTAGYHPNETRHTACMMIPEAGIIFDAGTGFFRVRDLIQTPDLHIFLSHSHLDHCFGLSFYIDVVFEKDVKNIFVYGAAEKLQAIQTHLFSEHLFPLAPDFHWTTIDKDSSISLPTAATLSVCDLQHPGGSFGFRVDWADRSIAYITDTTASVEADYIQFVKGCDVLLHECHFPDGLEDLAIKTGHSCLTPVAQVCRAAQVKRCTIVHLNPLSKKDPPLELSQVESVFESIELGYDGCVVQF